MSTGQIAGGVVGAAVGFVVGGPAGAVMGASLGMMAGGFLDPAKGPSVPGPQIKDLTVQTSTYGASIPRVYGTIAISGNILWLENDKLKVTIHKKKQGGKGGGSTTTVKTATYSATFAVGICQGEIAGVRRIWCADKLIYNAGSNDLDTIIAGNLNANGWRLYRGTDDQMPDSRHEADVGVGKASAFRGIAYIVFDDFQLADYSDTLQAANFKFEVMSASTPSGVCVSANYQSVTDATAVCPGNPYEGDSSGSFVYRDLSGEVLRAQYLNDQVIKKTAITTGSVHPISNTTESVGYVFRELHGSGVYGYNDLYFSYGSDTHHIVATVEGLVPTCFIEYGGSMFCEILDQGDSSNTYLTRIITPITGAAFDGRLDLGVQGPALAASGGSVYTILRSVFAGAIVITEYDAATFAFIRSFSVTTPGIDETVTSICPCAIDDDRLVIFIIVEGGYAKFATVDLSAETLETTISIAIPAEASESFGNGSFKLQRNLAAWGQGFTLGDVAHHQRLFFNLQLHTADTVPLSQIIGAEVKLSALIGPSDVDLSMLSDSVTGYRVSGGSIRSAIEPLQGAFPFDVIQSGYKIKAVPRGQSVAANIPLGDLGATDSGASVMLEQSREMDSQLPYRVAITYMDQAREYAVSEQYAERSFTGSVNRVDRQLPIVMSADKAASVAETLLFLPHLERVDLSFRLPPTYAALEPADVVTVNAQDATYAVRLTEVNYGSTGLIECKGKPNAATIYQSTAAGSESLGPDGTIPLAGTSVFLPLDIPIVDETAQNSAGFIGAMTGYSAGWPSAVLVRSSDGGQTWIDLQGFTGKATIGMTQDALPASSGTLMDLRTLNVMSVSGAFYSVTYDQMVGGVNYAAYGVDGRWEIVRFQNAYLQADGSYDISGFIRGERGTEWATGMHESGDYFILLDDPDLIFMGAAIEIIGTELDYRAVTSGASVDSASDQPFAYQGVNLECLSPIYPVGSRDGSENFIGSFTRRSRLSSSWWTTGVEAPVGEATEAYEIDVMDGATVRRTIAVSSPAFTYSAADQTTDFGSEQSSIALRIYQLSAVVGRGYPLEVTL